MSETWSTKWGARRVRHEPPTLAEALIAAQCFAEDGANQIEIAASLMGVELAVVEVEAAKLAAEQRTRTLITAPTRRGARTVVVERKASRRFTSREQQAATSRGVRAR